MGFSKHKRISKDNIVYLDEELSLWDEVSIMYQQDVEGMNKERQFRVITAMKKYMKTALSNYTNSN